MLQIISGYARKLLSTGKAKLNVDEKFQRSWRYRILRSCSPRRAWRHFTVAMGLDSLLGYCRLGRH
jgi:hypothetical protein